MAKKHQTAKQNPLGKVVPGGQLVRVGEGDLVHLFSPKFQMHLCKSGLNAGAKGGSGAMPVCRPVKNSKYVNCTRCMKLAELNIKAGRDPWDAGA